VNRRNFFGALLAFPATVSAWWSAVHSSKATRPSTLLAQWEAGNGHEPTKTSNASTIVLRNWTRTWIDAA